MQEHKENIEGSMRHHLSRAGLGSLVTLVMLGVTSQGIEADEIALSLVHGKDRIDVPASMLTSARLLELGHPVVEVCFSDSVKQRICELSRGIVGEPLEIWVNCRKFSAPVVREPLCHDPCFKISVFDLDEGERLVADLTGQAEVACP
jgi:hypothetical protein